VKSALLFLLVLLFSTFASAQDLPSLRIKPTPRFERNSFCPGDGLEDNDHNDPDLNKAKNRIDDADRYFQVGFDVIKNLEKPSGFKKIKRSKWAQADRNVVAKYEGIPIVLEGFLALTKRKEKLLGAVLQNAELCNCQRKETEHRDFHLWIVSKVGHLKNKSVVIEMTPRVRKNHPDWTIARLNNIGTNRFPIRVSGWLMFDQEHAGHIPKHRANLWEIHPIMKFEYKENGRWKQL